MGIALGPFDSEPHGLAVALRSLREQYPNDDAVVASARGSWLTEIVAAARGTVGFEDEAVIAELARLDEGAVQSIASWVTYAEQRASRDPESLVRCQVLTVLGPPSGQPSTSSYVEAMERWLTTMLVTAGVPLGRHDREVAAATAARGKRTAVTIAWWVTTAQASGRRRAHRQRLGRAPAR